MDPTQLHAPDSVPPDEQVVRAIAEQSMLCATFARLADEAKPQLAWRCELMYQAIRAALDEHFGGVDR